MDAIIISIVVSSVLVVLLLVMVARRPKIIDKIYAPMFAIIVIGGLLIYGYGFALHEKYLYSSIIRTTLQVIAMFAGKDQFSIVANTPFFSTLTGQIIFWTIHLLALYMTAGTVLLMIGSAVVQVYRRFILKHRRKPIDIIYGTDDNALEHAEALMKEFPKTMILFVHDHTISDYSKYANQNAYVALDRNAGHFEKNLGLKRKKEIRLYCMKSSERKNINFATTFDEMLKNAGKTSYLTIRCQETAVEETLLQQSSRYYSIFTYTEPELMARMITQKASFVDYVQFDDTGVAQNDLNIAVVGFGRMGQAIFLDTVRNTQFYGCKSNYYLIDRNLDEQWGPFKYRFTSMFKNYNITGISKDSNSSEMAEIMENAFPKLNVVFICAGDDENNDSLAYVWHNLVSDSCKIFECTETSYKIYQEYSEPVSLYGSGALITKKIDDRAIRVNQVYCNTDDPEQAWKQANEFSRQSSRAMADFIPAYQKIEKDNIPLSDELLENLSITEHMRWCAFHYTNSYKTMNEKTIRERAERRKQEIETKGSSDIRITVDRDARLHACLVDWDKLDDLSRLIEELTGEYIDYKELDRQNVRNIEHFIS